MEEQQNLIDGVFYAKHQRWGTWNSTDLQENRLVTSLTKEQCISATRFYLKGRQEGFTEPKKVHKGVVSGKL